MKEKRSHQGCVILKRLIEEEKRKKFGIIEEERESDRKIDRLLFGHVDGQVDRDRYINRWHRQERKQM